MSLTRAKDFIAATDRRGRPLYRDAEVVVELHDVAVLRWMTNETVPHQRFTLIDNVSGFCAPAIAGDAEYVGKWLAKRAHEYDIVGARRLIHA